MPPSNGKTKAQWVAEEVARAVNAGKPVAVETVDFSDPNRPKTCLEVDFPILPINQIAAIEGNAGKPIYQMSKWWARRRSSVFRSTLLAAAMKAPDDPSEAAKAVWDVYYCNHQKKGALKHLKVADIFMGGGTTLVEGSRLGFQMYGTDLNPVAWFVVKNEFAQVTKEEVEALLADVEAEVKPQIMPFYACDCPRGHRGTWTQVSTGKVMGKEFDPLALTPEERKDYRYDGPEIIYVFWAKHGPCQVTGCGHRTPIMSSPVMAVKTISVKAWPHKCPKCKGHYDIEEQDARMAPGVSLVVADTEEPFAVLDKRLGVDCPLCGHHEALPPVSGKGKKKKVELSLLVHPQWLAGEKGTDSKGKPYGGSATDDAESTAVWHRVRAKKMKLVEVRGALPDEVKCPDTGVTIKTGSDGGTVPKGGNFACGACGAVQPVVTSLEASGKTAPAAVFAIQGYCPKCDSTGQAYGGRFFASGDATDGADVAFLEWERRKTNDLKGYWPTSDIPFGHMTHQRQPLPQHGYLKWCDMFNPRQSLVLAQLLRAISASAPERHVWAVREFVLGAFQQYLRNQNMFCFWDIGYDKLVPSLSNANFHPKSNLVENSVFPTLGRGNWDTCSTLLLTTSEWIASPWELVSCDRLAASEPNLAGDLKGKSEKARPGDPVRNGAAVDCRSATELSTTSPGTYDLVVTDPPFGGNLHYSELSDFFYVWLRLVLKNRYPDYFTAEYTPKTLEAVANKARQPDDPDGFYQRLLTECWREAHRALKPGGTLAFTFHHSEDAPWVSVLESLFDAGFYLEATYPIRSDETKGKGEFGSKQIEYDIIHVCRKRHGEPSPVSWAKMRRQVLDDVRSLRELLEHHQKGGLPDADLQVIRRGKALEYFSRHYGKVYVDEGKPMSVEEALVGINQLLDEETGQVADPPPVTAEPFTRQFLRLFDKRSELPRDQMQKFLRGTGIAPSEFVERGWCSEVKKVYHLTPPIDIARDWQGRHRRKLTSDYDQAVFLIGACFENSGIKASDTLVNENFKPHPALGALLDWFSTRGAATEIRNAASRAGMILRTWKSKNQQQAQQMSLFFDDPGSGA
ncbi:MAG: DUF1156 domain-containing protein [Acidobacteriota bacterium]